MLSLRKPERLRSGDTVATVSLSWGGAGDPDLRWRYEIGKRRLEEQFGLHVVEMPNTLKGTEYLYQHPEVRAQDLMDAFSDPTIKGIFTCIGGEESIRLLPYVDFTIIEQNPKVFLGYSDSTIGHLFCLKAGLSSFYGPSVLAEFAENVRIFDYTADWVWRALFQAEPLGELTPAVRWTGEQIPWAEENITVEKQLRSNEGPDVLQGRGSTKGRLIGGCIDVLEMAKGTSLWPSFEAFEDCILFFETSEDQPSPMFFERWLRSYGSMGILQRAKALLFGKPCDGMHYAPYNAAIRKVLAELNLESLPVVCNLTFGHNEPMCTLPYGALTCVDCDAKTVTLLEAGVK